MLVHLLFCNSSVLLLIFCQLAHHLGELHFTLLVELFSLKHARLDLTDSLRIDLDLLRGQVFLLDALCAKDLFGGLIPRV